MSALGVRFPLPSASSIPRWLWCDPHFVSCPLSSNATTKSSNFGVPLPFAYQGAGVVRGPIPQSVHNWSEQSRKRKVGAEMENTTVEALTNGGDLKQSPKHLTLVIIKKDGKVLLGMKKRGFGAGYFNGFGGKVEANETIDEAAVRELQEESGVVPLSMEKRGILTFHFDDNPQPWEVHVYHVGDYAGEPCETEEMAPRWFSLADIPYDKMWQDDPIWYPEFLHGRHFKGEFYFHNTHTLVSHTLHTLQKLDA